MIDYIMDFCELESITPDMCELADEDCVNEFEYQDLLENLLESLTPEGRMVVEWKMEGYELEEIASMLSGYGLGDFFDRMDYAECVLDHVYLLLTSGEGEAPKVGTLRRA